MFGQGILTGLKITLKYMLRPAVTQFYPQVKPILFERARNSLHLNPEQCIACGICSTTCPNGVIALRTVKDANNKRILQSYTMNVGYCLFCGLCTEACPTGAITVVPDFENATFDGGELIWDMIERAPRSVEQSNTL